MSPDCLVLLAQLANCRFIQRRKLADPAGVPARGFTLEKFRRGGLEDPFVLLAYFQVGIQLLGVHAKVVREKEPEVG